MIELLAPAGTPEACRVAIAAGADAVYLGGNRFGARHFAGNFDDQALEEIVASAHLRGVKVYVTVNTLVHDTELVQVVRYLEFLCMIGVDAILIQDLGVLSLASSLFSGKPGTPALHASTQMAVHNREGALYAVEKGCTRIVLARELAAREVRDIAESLKESGAEVEIFGHGALCYAYSGQCLLSAVIGGRSGNRGMCAQPCRKPYELIKGVRDRYGRLTKPYPVDHPGQFLLSTRDLSVYPVLSSVASLPISALKIEGRMRTPSYVATVVSIYRRALDAVMAGTFSPSSEEETELALAYSRGFTTGYLNGESCQTVMGRGLPGRRGLLVGTVTGITREGWMNIKPAHDLVPERGDGLVCISNTREQGFVLRRDSVIQKGEVLLDSNISCHRGDQVYLTSRGRNIRLLEQLTSDPDTRYYGSIGLSLELNISPDGAVDITGTIRTRTKGTIPFSFRSGSQFSPARSRPLTADLINDAIRKTGGTLFTIDHLVTSCPDGLFAPISVLNGIRREILEFAQSCIIKSYLPEPELMQEIKDSAESCIEQLNYDQGTRKSNTRFSDLILMILVSDPASALSGVEAGASRAYIEWYPTSLSSHPSDQLDEILALFVADPSRADVIGIKLPKILLRSEMDRLIQALPVILKAGVRYLMVDGIGVAQAVLKIVPNMQVCGYSGLNITNHCSLEVHSQLEFCTLSCELSGDEIRVLLEKRTDPSRPVAIIVQGLLETIITEDRLCVSHHIPESNAVFAIRDQKDQVFLIVLDPANRTHIFNSAETSLIDHVKTLKEAGGIIGIIDARWRGSDYAGEMAAIWSDAINMPNVKQGELDSVKDAIRNYAWGVLTSATWKRGICRSDS
ncbi:U32 family peptidase [Methanospirillum lacunae]|uniref:Peptidase U32 n=1 Tax=Methanospirillum lacunae TaxID=668570 RepID=A0A2V2NBQ1_9EURY|nr:U32 family peptidase [Methanospirillum lacunae]PWR73898.1 peptidase U32 [Methanospirillum lacunae]